jgi:hypothetical protein|tara:strand:+ start:3891 stop:4511 length:621 start_codon:yes stop_codon:yes gene_type:complete
MKRPIIFSVIISLLSFGVIDSAALKKAESESNEIDLVDILKEQELEKQCLIESIILQEQYHQQQLDSFLTAVGFRESGNRYDITNKWGYMGKYQFGKSTLKGLGFKVTKKEFLSNPQLQEEAMMALLLHNKEKLQKYIDVFDGQTINGMLITESGILAAAHLGGQGSVKRYFKNGKVFRDGNGTKITSYMKKFSGYDIQLNYKLQS